MAKFRKKPVVIDAIQWFQNGDHPEDNSELIHTDEGKPFLSEGKVIRRFRRPDISGDAICSECHLQFHFHGWIDTLEDGHRVCPSDWIIKGIAGEFYPCKNKIFRDSYEPVDKEAENLWNK